MRRSCSSNPLRISVSFACSVSSTSCSITTRKPFGENTNGVGAFPSDSPIGQGLSFFSIGSSSKVLEAGRISGGGRFGDGEAEHHSALVVFGNVAVRHPSTGIGDAEKDFHGLVGSHQDGVLPHEVRIRLAVARQHEESAGTVD